jgi:hypothetical protein
MDLTNCTFVDGGYTLEFELGGLVAHVLMHLVKCSTIGGNLAQFSMPLLMGHFLLEI